MSGNTIEDLKAVLSQHGGMAPTNRFNIIFTPPQVSLINLNPTNLIASAIGGDFTFRNLINDPRDISLLCESAEIPGRQLASLEYQDQLEKRSVVHSISDPEITTTFLVTNDNYIKIMFEGWVSEIFDTSNYQVGYKKDYVADVRIQMLNRKNRVMYGIKLFNAYPTTLGGLTLDNTQTDAVQKLSISWAYDKWEPENAIQSRIGGALHTIGELLS